MAKRILVVDDDESLLRLERSVLEHFGYHVEEAANGTAALAALDGPRFDLILLDVMMPDIDGFTVCRHIKADPHLEPTPVVFVSAKTDAEAMTEGYECGAAMYVTKPISPPALVTVVRSILDRQN